MGSDGCRQLIDKQPAGLLRMFERRNQSAHQIGENGIRMGGDSVQRRYCRDIGFLGDQGKRVGRNLEEKKIEGSSEIGLIVLSQNADVDRIVVEDMRCRVVLMKNAAGMAWKRRDANRKSTVAGGGGDLLQEGVP